MDEHTKELIAIGAFIHGYVPQDFLARWAGRDNPFAVPVAVALGVPLYSNVAGVIPIVQALTAKGMAIGTVLAFMMASSCQYIDWICRK